MAFLILGLALLAMKMASFGPAASWSWFIVLAPFGAAVAWWAYADSSGLTQRRAIRRMERRKEERRERALHNLGLGTTPQRSNGIVRDPPRRSDADPTPSVTPSTLGGPKSRQ
jgi:small Trp-rich protein